MTDQELLEWAAKAARIEGTFQDLYGFSGITNGDLAPWNPLLYDSDALKLAVKAGIFLNYYDQWLYGFKYCVHTMSYPPEEGTRRAIVMVAADIGKGMT